MKRKVLIIEDNLISSTALEMMILSNGFESVGKYDSADELLKLYSSTMPDLILLDIMLNGKKNGLEAAKELRTKSNVPIVFLTALSDSDSMTAIKEIENSSATFKPYAEELILQEMKKFF
ncbi:MAG: response regulator [Bacteroidota bacterium]